MTKKKRRAETLMFSDQNGGSRHGSSWRVRSSRVLTLVCLLSLYLGGLLLLSSVSIEPRYSKGIGGRLGGVGGRHLGSIEVPVARHGRAGARRSRLHWCRPLHFQQPPGPVVALVSFPGSGNTWLRYLLQQATGVYTGSVYKDYGLLKNGFPAESVCNGSVLVVKTHEWGAAARQPFSRALLLVRAPGPAILAEFNRQSGGHVGYASPDRYHRNRDWRTFVQSMVASWRRVNLDWLRNFTGSVDVVRYEDLSDSPVLGVRLASILGFLGVEVSEDQLACAVARREGIYRRRRRVAHFDPFSAEMKAELRAAEDEVYSAIRAFQLQRPRVLGVADLPSDPSDVLEEPTEEPHR